MHPSIQLSEQYSAGHVAPYPLLITRGEGVQVYDQNGRAYWDMAAGVAVVNFGHSHPRLVQALVAQAQQIAIVPRLFHNQPLARLMQRLCQLTAMDKAIAMNSGAEAVETAIKLARKWGYEVKGVADNQAQIIVCDNSFHGRTLTAVSMSSIDKYKRHFGPLTPGFVSVPFNDSAALAQAITPNTVAFLVEPIQGEAGVVLPTSGYLAQCHALCQQHKLLFMVDEIQTGMGRTGRLLALQHAGLQADLLLLGKALGGGLLAISMVLASEQIMGVLKPGEHGSTFGGNPLAAAVAYEALVVLEEENLCQHATRMGEYFLGKLTQIRSPLIRCARGKGLMLAIELDKGILSARTMVENLIQHGLLSVATREDVIRLLPPLVITKQQIDTVVSIIVRCLQQTERKLYASHIASQRKPAHA
jgi:ornithine--oxo-acid transaminase